MWATRTVCTFVAATVPIEPGQSNPLLTSAQTIGDALFGEKPDEPAQAKANDAQPGSFEMFMGSFGSPHKWAGHN